jgi:hypothetical protein
VNPAHLEPVTGRENTLRGINPAAVHARQTHCKRGHPFDEKNTRVSSRGNRICAACTPFLPSRIAKRRQWPLTETKVPA